MLSDKKREELKCKYRILKCVANGEATGTEVSLSARNFKARVRRSCLKSLAATGCIEKRIRDSLMDSGRKPTLINITEKGKAEIKAIEEAFNNG